MESKHIYLGIIVVIVIIAAGYFAWHKYHKEHFEAPNLPDNPDIQRDIGNLGIELERATLGLQNFERGFQAFPKANIDALNAAWPGFQDVRVRAMMLQEQYVTGARMLAASGRKYSVLRARMLAEGARTRRIMGQSYRDSYTYLVGLYDKLTAAAQEIGTAMMARGTPPADRRNPAPGTIASAKPPVATWIAGYMFDNMSKYLGHVSADIARMELYAEALTKE